LLPVTSEQVDEFFAGRPLGPAVFDRVTDLLAAIPGCEVRVTRSQIAFTRRRAFAWLWSPGRWLTRPAAEVVLSVSLGRPDPSPRFKEVVHPAQASWMHHLEITAAAEVDDEVAGWLREAADRAG
jgi:Domain of unknown function (DUF5655)